MPCADIKSIGGKRKERRHFIIAAAARIVDVYANVQYLG